MKKIFIGLFALVLMLGVGGCSSDETKENSGTDTTTQKEMKKELSFETIKKALQDNGYTILEERETMAVLIGAKDGIKYDTEEEGTLEFYKFDTSGDAYKKIKKEGIVTLEGFGDFEVVLNGEFAMMSEDVSEDLIKLFKSL